MKKQTWQKRADEITENEAKKNREICVGEFKKRDDMTKIKDHPITAWSPLRIWEEAWKASRESLPIGEGFLLDIENMSKEKKK